MNDDRKYKHKFPESHDKAGINNRVKLFLSSFDKTSNMIEK